MQKELPDENGIIRKMENGRGFGFYFSKFMFCWFMLSTIAMMFVIYPYGLGWISPRVYFGFLPIMSLCEMYGEIGFGVAAYFWLTKYWPDRHDYEYESLEEQV